MKKIITCLTVIMLVAVFAVAANAQVKKSAASKALQMQAASGSGSAASASRFTISPKLSYVGSLGLGVEFSPLMKISDDIDLMGEVNWDFASWSGTSGYIYGGINGVYKLKPVAQGDKSLNPYVGGGLIYGFPMGTPNTGWGGSFGGGIGFGIFGGVTTQFDPYTVYAQIKYATAPITYSWPNVGWIPAGSSSYNALGMGMEFGARFPL